MNPLEWQNSTWERISAFSKKAGSFQKILQRVQATKRNRWLQADWRGKGGKACAAKPLYASSRDPLSRSGGRGVVPPSTPQNPPPRPQPGRLRYRVCLFTAPLRCGVGLVAAPHRAALSPQPGARAQSPAQRLPPRPPSRCPARLPGRTLLHIPLLPLALPLTRSRESWLPGPSTLMLG